MALAFLHNLKMGRNTVGGKNFKKFKSGGEGFRAKASREAGDEIVALMSNIYSKIPQPPLDATEQEAVKYLLVGRIIKKFGFGRNEVYCHDGTTRQCRIRGLLRKKGQVNIDMNTMVVVSLREALSDSSDNETHIGGGSSVAGDGDIIGALSDKHIAQLRRTTINPKIFSDANSTDNGTEDFFDRSDILNEIGEGDIDGKKAKAPVEVEIDLSDL